MALAFPAGPTSGQQYTGPNGVVYQWDSAVGVWIKVNSVQTVTSGATAATGAARIPTGNTAARPAATLAAGQFRYNSQIPQLEYSDGTAWLAVGGGGGGTVTGVTATAPLASSGGAAPDISLTGTIPVLNGGTGATTVTGAQANLLPAQAGNAGKVLTTDGAGVLSWAATGGSGTVSSIDVSGGTTGLTYSGGPVTASGTITMAGTLAVANGGTGATTAAGAQVNLLPAQATHAGEYLQTDGAGVLSWQPAGGGTNPIPAGTVMLFAQASAPVGWTQVTTATYGDAAVRLVTAAGGGTGGSATFSSLLNSASTASASLTITSGSVSSTTLSTSQLASHSHPISGGGGGSLPYGTFQNSSQAIQGYGVAANTPLFVVSGTLGGVAANTDSVGSDASHTHSLAGSVAAGNLTTNFNIKYVDIIACSKN